jgi:hypothetical protein
MSFASSLLAFSLHSLAAQPTVAAHTGIEVAFANFFNAMGGKVSLNNKIPSGKETFWRPDSVIDFGDFQVILEISSHESSSGMAFIHSQPQNGFRTESHHNKVKQALAYASKMNITKPTICMVASNLEFVAFNPESFNLNALRRNLTKVPSLYDPKAGQWVKKQKAFKVIKKQTVESLANFSKDDFITYLRTVAGLPPQEVRLVAE